MTKQDELRAWKGLMSVREVAETLGSHIQTVYSWVDESKLPHFRVGGRIKFDGKAIADWLDRRAS
jgi:excisionase family DNA binding protein